MTRDEAKAKVRQSNPDPGVYTSFEDSLVDALSDLGILNLDEPISAHERFVSEMRKAGYHATSMAMADIRTALENAGLQIVEK